MAEDIEPLRYPLPQTLWARCWFGLRAIVNKNIRFIFPLLNTFRCRFTVIDHFGTPGDSILAASLGHSLKRKFPRLRLNLISRSEALYIHDLVFESLNNVESYFAMTFIYLDFISRRESEQSVLGPSLRLLGLEFAANPGICLTEKEIEAAKRELADFDSRPVVGFNVHSREDVKDWHLERWRELIGAISKDYNLIQLGDQREPEFANVRRYAGELKLRESLAMLSLADVHIGPDSFLIHGAHALGVPCVAIFGGARPVKCFGYPENINLASTVDCSPCWIHNSRGETCPFNKKCMDQISVQDVIAGVKRLLDGKERSCSQTVESNAADFSLRSGS